MAFASYSVRYVCWPLWAWEVELQDGAERRGYALGKAAARWAARECIRNARRSSQALGTEADSGGDR